MVSPVDLAVGQQHKHEIPKGHHVSSQGFSWNIGI